MPILRFLMQLSLAVWVGGLIFFAFIMAPAVFSVLPSRQLAGAIVARTLPELHWLAIVAGIIFLAASIAHNRMASGSIRLRSVSHAVLALMLALTAVLQFSVVPRMGALRSSMGQIDSVPFDSPIRVQFDALHVWSTQIEGVILILGLVLIYRTAQGVGASYR